MDSIFGAMSPQMLRIMFASRESQEQGEQMIIGMLRETGVREIVTEENGVDTVLMVPEYAESVMRTLLAQFDLPYLIGGDDATTG